MKHLDSRRKLLAFRLVLASTAALFGACGGAGGGPGPEGSGQGLALETCNVASLDNVPINRTCVFIFSEPVEPSTIYFVDAAGRKQGTGSIQIRQGPEFGITASGEFDVIGEKVYFTPTLPGRRLAPGETPDCDLADAGFQPDRDYRITLIGHPEHLAIRNTVGQPLRETQTLEFRTLSKEDPRLLEDQQPAVRPTVLNTYPADRAASVAVGSGSKIGGGSQGSVLGTPDAIEILLSESLNPCSVDGTSVLLHVYERGDPLDGFVPAQDSAPGDPFSWGSANAGSLTPEQRIPAYIELRQTASETRLILTPTFGRFPENALVVVELTAGIEDFGGNWMAPHILSFTTANLTNPSAQLRVEYDETTPISEDETTAAVHLPVAESKAQGFINIAGDGDNGPDLETPTYPAVLDPPFCEFRPNDDPDHFAPIEDVWLDTGASPNTCPNTVDGSTAVVWEFTTFTINPGITVTITGVNPAIILVTGAVVIKTGGELVVNGQPGEVGNPTTTRSALPPLGAKGGEGVAGGGDGGDSNAPPATRPDLNPAYGDDGWAGYGSEDFPDDPESGEGAGQGNAAQDFCVFVPGGVTGSSSGSGGGAGHAETGVDGSAYIDANYCWLADTRGRGGAAYPGGAIGDLMLTPSAGSGGGAAGYCDGNPLGNRQGGIMATGGGGGGGGGFVDITSASSITVRGTISAKGGKGGNGGLSFFIDTGDTGGGGGGSGGGIRLLTPGYMDIAGATLDAGGGRGGTGYVSIWLNGGAPANHGGDGSQGRIVLEDSDGVISGQESANLVPAEGEVGFYRGQFNGSRFVGGGRVTTALSEPMFVGPLTAPDLRVPVQADFEAGFPTIASDGVGSTGILVEIQGYPLLPNGTADLGAGTGWWTVGYLSDSGNVKAPTWVPSANPADVTLPVDNAGVGIDAVDGAGFVQIRLTFYLGANTPTGVGGPYIDRFDLKFDYDDL